MRQLALMSAFLIPFLCGSFFPTHAYADVIQSVANVVTTDAPTSDGGWSQDLGNGISGSLSEASFTIDWFSPQGFADRLAFGIDACSDAEYQSCGSVNNVSLYFSAPNGTTTVTFNAQSLGTSLNMNFDPSKYYRIRIFRILGPGYNTDRTFRVLGSNTDTYSAGSTDAGGLSDLSFSLKGISYVGTSSPPVTSGVVLNHAIGGSILLAPNFTAGGVPEGIGIQEELLNSIPSGDYYAVVFFEGLPGCPSNNYEINSFVPGAYWGYDVRPTPFSKAASTHGGGCMQQFHIDQTKGAPWMWGALSNTGKANAIADTNNIPAFAVCYDAVSCDSIIPTIATSTPSGPSSVLFLPGIEGSRLYQNILGIENKRWELTPLSFQTDAQALDLNADGTSINSIYTKEGDIVAHVELPFTDIDVYRSFIEELASLRSSQVIHDYRVFAYDWRMSPEDVVEKGTPYNDGTHFLDREVIALASSSPNGKVTIVAHSNGGLVAKALMNKLVDEGMAGIVDKIVLVDVPQIGTPLATMSILHGDSQKFPGFILSQSTARTLSENMPDAYDLLPSPAYFSAITDPVIDLSSAPKLKAASGITDDVINSEDLFEKFMTTESGRIKPNTTDINTPNVLSSGLFTNAKELHQNLDNWTPPAGVDVIQIAGWGRTTIKGVQYIEKNSYLCSLGQSVCPLGVELEHNPITTEDGDDTVVTASESINPEWNTYYLNLPTANFEFQKNWGHADITESAPFQALFPLLMSGSSTPVLPAYISTTLPPSTATGKRLQLRIHSPVAIDAVDIQGRHTGTYQTSGGLSYVEQQIPNSSYEEFGHEKFLSLPDDSTIRINLQGEDTGTFTLDVTKILETGQATTVTYSDMPVTASTTGTVITSSDQPILVLDINGDGKTDVSLSSSSQDLDPLTYVRSIEKLIDTMSLSTALHNQLHAKYSNLEHLFLKDGKWDKGDDDNDSADSKKKESSNSLILRKIDKINTYLNRILNNGEKTHGLNLTPKEASIILDMNSHLKKLLD